MNKKRTKIQATLAISISLVTIFLLNPKGTSLREIFSNISHYEFLFCAGGFFLFFILMEALTFQYIFKLQGLSVPLKRTYGYSLVDYFFSAASPGGSAGQPGQLYYMSQDEIPLAACMMGLVVFNTMYHLAMVVIGILAHGFYKELFLNLPFRIQLLMNLGLLIQVFFTIFQGGLMVSQKKVPRVILGFLRKMKERKVIFFRKIDEEAAKKTMVQYGKYGGYFKENPQKLFPIFLMNMFLLVFSYGISYFVYRSLGHQDLNFIKTIALQSQLVVSMESLPLPGGVGAAEDIFFNVYQGYVPQDAAFTWMILTRLLTYYFGLALGLVAVLLLGAKTYKVKEKSKEQ